MPEIETILARMEINRRRGVGIHLSYDDLQVLSVSFLGQTMQDCYEEMIKPATHPEQATTAEPGGPPPAVQADGDKGSGGVS